MKSLINNARTDFRKNSTLQYFYFLCLCILWLVFNCLPPKEWCYIFTGCLCCFIYNFSGISHWFYSDRFKVKRSCVYCFWLNFQITLWNLLIKINSSIFWSNPMPNKQIYLCVKSIKIWTREWNEKSIMVNGNGWCAFVWTRILKPIT